MKYQKADAILPDTLVEELQKYVQGGYIYIPSKRENKKQWGERSGYRKELDRRNAAILDEYKTGMPIDQLACRYHLSVYTIRKIIYKKK